MKIRARQSLYVASFFVFHGAYTSLLLSGIPTSENDKKLKWPSNLPLFRNTQDKPISRWAIVSFCLIYLKTPFRYRLKIKDKYKTNNNRIAFINSSLSSVLSAVATTFHQISDRNFEFISSQLDITNCLSVCFVFLLLFFVVVVIFPRFGQLISLIYSNHLVSTSG